MLAWPCFASARDTSGFGQVQRYLFVPEAGSSKVEVIDTDADQAVGAVDLGLVPAQVEVSAALAKLVTTDGRSSAVTVSDLVGGTNAVIPLSLVARRLTLSPDGLSVAVTDLDGGGVAVVDLLFGREVMHIGGLSPVRDLMFGGEGGVLYYVGAGVAGVGVIDIGASRTAAPIDVPHAAGGGLASLRRSPDGRRGFAHALSGGPIAVIDLARGLSVGEIATTAGGQLFPSGTGARFILLEPASLQLSVLRGDGTERVTLAGSEGADAVYPAWLDTVAFVPSPARRRLLIYDLDQSRLFGENPASGRAGARQRHRRQPETLCADRRCPAAAGGGRAGAPGGAQHRPRG